MSPNVDSASAIDLRSDTVTRPSAAMRAAMADAPVGDDQFGEDPTVNLLQERMATLLGKEAALWVPTGTMANQVAVRVLTQPGDAVILSQESHVALHETGGAAANSGVMLIPVGARGIFAADDVRAAYIARGHIVRPPTTLVAVENTHNLSGGVVFPMSSVREICAFAGASDMRTYLDGARLWNASVATGMPVSDLAAPFDLVSVALSKGLCAPGGSVLAGTKPIIQRAVRYRRMFGGAMRQVGILAAAGLHGLDHHVTRLADDHANAARLAQRLAQSPRVVLDPSTVQTNIVVFQVTPDAPDAATIVTRARERGVLLFAFGPRTLRLVTHADVTSEQCVQAAETLAAICET
jgi:threonine aldolase